MSRICRIIFFLKSSTEDQKSSKLRIVRCTLNTAALIGSSCSVYSQNGNLSEQDKILTNHLLSSVGPCYGEVKDSDMDAAMAVCSCGIAYMFMFTGIIYVFSLHSIMCFEQSFYTMMRKNQKAKYFF
jgi:pyrroline-5-carboxylate reductase